MTDDKRPREWTKFVVGSHWVLVDTEDIPILSRFTWSVRKNRKTFYSVTNVRIGGKQTSVSMHRLILGLPSSEIDHINRNGLDNRKSNLRFCTKAENQRNRVRVNKFGYRGVYWHSGRFACQIQLDGKRVHRYGFATAELAAREYDKLSKELHGEFGIRNFKD